MDTIFSSTDGPNAFQHMLHPSQLRAYFAAHAPITFSDACTVFNETGRMSEDGLDVITMMATMSIVYADKMLAMLNVEQTPLQRAAAAGEDTTGLGTVRDAIAYMLEGSNPTHQMEMVVPLDGQRFNIMINIMKVTDL